MKQNRYIVFAAMGIELVGLIVGSLYLGQIIDNHYGTKGMVMVGLSLASLAGWLYHIVVLTKKIDENSDKE